MTAREDELKDAKKREKQIKQLREQSIARVLAEGDTYELTDYRRALALTWDYGKLIGPYAREDFIRTSLCDLTDMMATHGITYKMMEHLVAVNAFSYLLDIKVEPGGFMKKPRYFAKAHWDLHRWLQVNPPNPTGGNPWHDPKRRPL